MAIKMFQKFMEKSTLILIYILNIILQINLARSSAPDRATVRHFTLLDGTQFVSQSIQTLHYSRCYRTMREVYRVKQKHPLHLKPIEFQ